MSSSAPDVEVVTPMERRMSSMRAGGGGEGRGLSVCKRDGVPRCVQRQVVRKLKPHVLMRAAGGGSDEGT